LHRGAGRGIQDRMSETLLLAVLPFVVSTSVTPGPNNLMVMTSAVNFGVRRTLPHILGIMVGFPLMVVAVGLGLAPVFETWPVLHQALKIGGAAYMLWLAWQITRPGEIGEGRRGPRPIGFLQAAAFQWINPKAWIMALGAIATYTTIGGRLLAETLMIALTFMAVSIPSNAFWVGLGVGVRRFLANPRALRIFNGIMAALLAGSLIPLFL